MPENIDYSEIEWMCKDLCFQFGENDYEKYDREIPQFCDLLTRYESKNFMIHHVSICDGGYYMEVEYNGRSVLTSKRGEGEINFYLRRIEDFMEILSISQDEAKKEQEKVKHIGESALEIHRVKIDHGEWIDELRELWQANPNRTMIKLS